MQFFFDMKTPFIDFMLPSELLEKRKDKFQSNFMNFVLWYFGFRVILTDVVIVHSDIFNLLLLLLLLLVVVVVVVVVVAGIKYLQYYYYYYYYYYRFLTWRIKIFNTALFAVFTL